MTPLEGWKQVAHYMKRTERTVQTWARERSMPIHRTSEGKGRIWVEPSELDRWKAENGRVRRACRKAVTVRLPERDYERLKRLRPTGTVQDLVLHAVTDYLQRLSV
jgi:hypothetical protein